MKYKVSDISLNNGNVNFAKVKKAVDGIIVRIGYRGYRTGTLVTDQNFHNYMKQIKANNIKEVAFYFFTQAISEKESNEEANYAFKLAKKYVENPVIYVDSEYSNINHDGRADKLSAKDRTRFVKAFCDKIIALGGISGVYASDSWYKNKLELQDLNYYSLWVAKYSKERPQYVKEYDGWQYTSTNNTDGITMPTKGSDMSVFTKKLSEIRNPLNDSISTDDKIRLSMTQLKEYTMNIQTWLNGTFGNEISKCSACGCSKLKVDGILGKKTIAALTVALQVALNEMYKVNLKVDGIFGTATKSACKVVQLGCTGTIVLVCEAILFCSGYFPGDFSGNCTESVVKAIKLYQSDRRIVVDGKFGKESFDSFL